MKKAFPNKLLVLLVLSTMALSACGEQISNNSTVKTPVNVAPVGKTEVKSTAGVEVTEKKDNGQESTVVDNSEISFSPLKNIDTEKVLATYKTEMIKLQEAMYAENSDPANKPTLDWKNDIADYYRFYDAGEIKVAPYQGQRLVIADMQCDGPCGSAIISRFAMDEKTGKLTWLEALSNGDWMPDHFKALQKDKDTKFMVKALDIPNSIMLPDGKNSIGLELMGIDMEKTAQDKIPDADGNTAYDFATLGKVAFHDAKWGDLYFSGAPAISGCLYLKTADGVISSYAYNPGLQDEKRYQSVKWTDGSFPVSLNTDYSPLFRGCGVGNSCYFVETLTEDQLVETGKATNGMSIYEAKDNKQNKVDEATAYSGDPNATLNQTFNSYDEMYQYYDESTKAEHPKKTYAEFVKSHPVIYWKDPFGRFSALIQNDVKPPAECGKPVIYLYPQKPTEVSVKVGIDQFTKTVPAYGTEGWKVVARPNGEIKNLADGENYPYLFWEGESKKEVAINGGFVVAKDDLKKFLTESLSKLGLNEKESADFKDFWLSKMEAVKAPYLMISFVGTSDFNTVAPLSISPKPDTLIRVFMYYQPLAAKIEIPAQKLSAIPRKGFTVVEWGGTSSDGWQTK